MTSLACLERPATPTADRDGMSLVEAMAKSRHDRLQVGPKPVAWEEAHPDYRDKMMREAAADLIALVEVLHPILW
jgi:hypothetical protein